MIPPFGLPTSQFSFLNFFDCLSLLEARNNLILSTIRRYCYRKQALLSTFLLYIYIRVLYKNGYIVLSITYYNTFGTSNHFLSISSITFGTGNYFRIVAQVINVFRIQIINALKKKICLGSSLISDWVGRTQFTVTSIVFLWSFHLINHFPTFQVFVRRSNFCSQ